MKPALSTLLSSVALALAGTALWTTGKPQPALAERMEESPDHTTLPEIGDWMRPLQGHASKLWFAGKHQNWNLALYQLEEIDELMEEIEAHDLKEGTVDIGGLMGAIRRNQVSALREAAIGTDPSQFVDAYDRLLADCNLCHKQSGHAYIQIRRPTRPDFSNQDFSAD